MKKAPRSSRHSSGAAPQQRLLMEKGSSAASESAVPPRGEAETATPRNSVSAATDSALPHRPSMSASQPSTKRTRDESIEPVKSTEKPPLAAAAPAAVAAAPPSRRARVEPAKPLHDPIFRIMHRLPRSDVLEVVKCKFGKEHCARAADYFDASFMKNPLRRLRLQVGCSGPGGLHLFFPRIFFHRFALRTLDLSRNKLSADDVATLCDGLALTGSQSSPGSPPSPTSPVGSSVPVEHTTSSLELLNLSYNLGIGNRGAVHLLRALHHNTTVRAVLLASVGVDDDGAAQLAPLLRARPRPLVGEDGQVANVGYRQGYLGGTERRPYTFFVNLNHNVIGGAGTEALGKGLPSYVSVTLSKQRLKGSDNPLKKRKRRDRRGARK